MRKRLFRVVGVVACACSLQLVGCQSQKVADILAGSVSVAAVDVSSFVVGSVVDNAFGIE